MSVGSHLQENLFFSARHKLDPMSVGSHLSQKKLFIFFTLYMIIVHKYGGPYVLRWKPSKIYFLVHVTKWTLCPSVKTFCIYSRCANFPIYTFTQYYTAPLANIYIFRTVAPMANIYISFYIFFLGFPWVYENTV